jgi:hypothetical protein
MAQMSTTKKHFLFVHIPKTAGTSFALILTRQFGWFKKLSFYSPEARKRYPLLTADKKNKYDLSYGHIPFMADQGLERGIEYYTFLRAPRERLLSGYRHVKGDGNHVIKKVINVADYSIKDFLKQGLIKNMDNLMTRFLANKMDKEYLKINDDDLRLAIKNLDEHFSIFGLTEYFDESLVLLSDHMNWPPLYYVKENKSSYKIDPKELDKETEELMHACNKYDEVLYQHALDRFKKMMEAKKEIVETGLVKLRDGNRKYKTIISFRNKANLLYAYFRKKMAKYV